MDAWDGQVMSRAFSAPICFGGIYPGRCPRAGMNNAVGVVPRVLTILKLAALTQAAEHVGNDKPEDGGTPTTGHEATAALCEMGRGSSPTAV